MEQLAEVFGVNWKLLIAQGVNFGVLLAALSYFLYTPVLRMLDERKKMIADGVLAARDAQKRLESSQVEAQGIVGGAAREAETLVRDARTRAQEKADGIVGEARAHAEETLAQAHVQAQEARARALQESEKDIARAAVLAAEQILRGATGGAKGA